MKKIKLIKTTNLTGKSFAFPKFDEYERPVIKKGEDGKEELELTTTTSLLDIIEYFILRGIPGQKYTKNDAIHVGNIYRFIQEARRSKAEVLEIGEDDHDWLKVKLNDDEVGVRMFTRNHTIIMEAVEDIVKPHEPKEK